MSPILRFAKTTEKTMCISIADVKLWNKIDANIRHSLRLHIFQTKLKNRLLENYIYN